MMAILHFLFYYMYFVCLAGYNGSSHSSPPRCIMHGFTVHTKYELAPPYPTFAPKIFLKLDGVAVVNTGDSLVALSVDIEDNHGGFGFGLYSPRVARTMSTISSVSSPSDDQISTDSHDPLSEREQERETATDLLGSFLPSPPPCVYSRVASYTPKDTTNMASTSERPAHLRERRVSSTGKENQLNKSLDSPLSIAKMETPNKTQRSIDVYNFEANTPTPKKEEDSGEFIEVMTEATGSSFSRATVRTSLTFPQGARLLNTSNTTADEISLCQNDSMESQPLEQDIDKSDPFEKPPAPQRVTIGRDPSTQTTRVYTALTLNPPDGYPLVKALCSPGYLKYDTASSTCSSCVSSPIILQSDSQCFTYSVRRYIECFGVEGPIDVEGKNEL